MERPLKQDEDSPDRTEIEGFLRLALAPPDDDLLRRYFAERAGLSGPSQAPLSRAERKWVTVNLEANPRWQEQWRRLEEASGRVVDPGVSSFSLPTDRPGKPLRILRSLSPLRLAVAASLALLFVYGTLWLVGRTTLPDTYALASVSAHEDALRQQVRLESPTAPGDVAQATEALLNARESTLGLFPHYDQARVTRAVVHLERAREAATDPFQRAEIAFFLAKAHLMQEDVAAARGALQEVLAQNVAVYRSEAEALLLLLVDL